MQPLDKILQSYYNYSIKIKKGVLPMKLNEFEQMTDEQKCEFINKHFENHTTKTFKTKEVDFSWSQASGIISKNKNIVKFEGRYMTKAQVAEFVKPEPTAAELDNDEIGKLKAILEEDKYSKLLTLLDKYSYVADFIIREDRSVKIKNGSGEVKTTSMRMYADTLDKWKEYAAKSEFSSLDLLNTALVEFMENHH